MADTVMGIVGAEQEYREENGFVKPETLSCLCRGAFHANGPAICFVHMDSGARFPRGAHD